MKLKRHELALLVLALCAIVFTAGYFTGRLTAKNQITVSASDYASSPVSSAASAGTQEDISPVNLNTADADTLCTLPGIGPELADSIIAYREEHNGFTVPSELMNISGIGSATYEKLKAYVTVSEGDNS